MLSDIAKIEEEAFRMMRSN